jgi:hypothetical protein
MRGGGTKQGALLALALAACSPTSRPVAAGDCAAGDPTCAGPTPAPACTDDGALRVFAQRIEPLLREDRPSSCNRCHLTDVNLGAFVRGSPCRSMACLREKGLVDFSAPDDSLILHWIERGTDAGGAGARAALQEYAGFRDWIRYSARCQDAICGPIADPCGQDAGAPDAALPDAALRDAVVRDAAVRDAAPADAVVTDASPRDAAAPDAAVRDASVPDAAPPDAADAGPCGETALATLLQERILRWQGRCNHCHQPGGLTAGIGGAPLWLGEGDDLTAARQTMHNVVALALVDAHMPDQSLLLRKPLAERAGGLRHGGGTKFPDTDDEAYQDFRFWIVTWAACVNPPDGGPPR